jgi:hypothetical protein
VNGPWFNVLTDTSIALGFEAGAFSPQPSVGFAGLDSGQKNSLIEEVTSLLRRLNLITEEVESPPT